MTHVREATLSELPAVLNVLDGSLLQTAHDSIEGAIEAGDVLVAVADGPDNPKILGALVLDGQVIEAVAVRRRRRGQGIGSALVTTAGHRHERLVAHFRESVRPFWESLGFEVQPADADDRLHGVLHTE